MTNLATLSNEEFRDEVTELIFDRYHWHLLLDLKVVDRARAVLTDIIVSVDQQLERHAESPKSEEWAQRARGYRLQVVRRLVQVKKVIRERDREELLALENGRKEWAVFALTLADALADSNMAYLLDDVEFQGQTAWEWLWDAKERAAVVA